jgi:extradiol dioxygenase family protein
VLFQFGREIHRLADDGVFQARVVAHCAEQHRAGGDGAVDPRTVAPRAFTVRLPGGRFPQRRFQRGKRVGRRTV